MDLRQPSNIIEACADGDLLNVTLSPAQTALLAGIYGLPMPSEECEALFKEATSRTEYVPGTPFRDVSVLAGRRSGKSTRIAAPIAVYESCIVSHEVPENERGLVEVLAPSVRQGRATFKVILRMLQRSPELSGLIESVKTGNEFEIALSNRRDIRVLSANSRTIRGDLVICAILEESCFFQDSDSGQFNLDEVLTALRPALLTVPGSKCIRVSSPWVASGPMFDDYQNRATRPETLVWSLESWKMQPSLSTALLWLEKKRDEQRFDREYGCKFLDAASALIPAEKIDAAIVRGTREFPNRCNLRSVVGLDPASRGTDSFAFAIAHREDDGKIVLDLAREWKAPGGGQFIDYDRVLGEIMDTANRYEACQVFSDQVCAGALAAQFEKRGFQFTQTQTFGTKAAEKYATTRQLFLSGKVVLPDNPELTAQLKKLEELLDTGGRSIVQGRGHDDMAIAACLALYEASIRPVQTEPIVEAMFVAPGVANTSWSEDKFFVPKTRVPSFARTQF